MTLSPDGTPVEIEGRLQPAVDPEQQPERRIQPRTLETAAKWSIVGLLTLAIMALCFGLGFGVRIATEGPGGPATQAVTTGHGTPNFSVLSEIYSDIMAHYVGASTLDPQALRQGAIDGEIKAVGDPHMTYLTQSEVLAAGDSTTGSFSGIGSEVQQKNGQLLLSPLPDTPAAKAGIKPDDILLSVNGASTTGWTEMDAVNKIRGPRGTTVKLGIKHATGEQVDLSITRDTIDITSVKTQDLHDADGNPVNDIGYVQITEFTERTPQELQTYLNGIQDKHYKGLIVDLRNNPGGVVDSVIQVAGEFLNQNPVLIVQSNNGSEQTVKPPNKGIFTKIPMVVLVNHDSASASEILSGALRDDKRATIIGETTFGKGTENIVVPLQSDPGAVYITVARWLTPNHTSIEGTGIKPDIQATAADNEDPNATFNAVLYRGITFLETGK